METEEIRKHRRGKGGNEPNNLGVNRISQLPDPLLHHILSFLPTIYVVRTSILSKRWRRVWISVPVLYFEEFNDVTFEGITVKNIRHRFFKFVDKFLLCRKLANQFSTDTLIMTRFKLDMDYHSGVRISEKIDDWLKFAVQGNVKELDLRIKPCYKRNYCIPYSTILNSRSLTLLRLEHLKLEILTPVSLPSLKALYFKYVEFDDGTLQNLISGCPIIMDLHLSMNTLFSISGVNFASCGTLRTLSLGHVLFTDEWLEDQISRLPLVESLTLDNCPGLKHFSIHSNSLKSLFINVYHSIEATFTTPNLVRFRYIVDAKSIISIDAPNNMFEAIMDIQHCNTNGTWYYDLIHFLSNLSYLKKMTLSTYSVEVFIIPENVRSICRSPLPDLKHMKVEITKSNYALNNESELKLKLRDALLWCAPSVETLEIV